MRERKKEAWDVFECNKMENGKLEIEYMRETEK